ncbi:MAG: glycoside hydrolase family 15 protein [Myxococcota bacterium]
MDLYSAARRLSRPFTFGEQDDATALPIDARGLIGDGHTCALVRADGAIDWACFPRYDSPSVFAAILDPDAGGMTCMTPTARPFESLQRYDPDTNVLETLFRVQDQGVVRLLDYMPWSDDPKAGLHELHRRVEVREGEVELEVIFDPRFDYGRGQTSVERREHGVLATGPGGERMVAVLGADAQWEPRARGGMQARLRMRAGDRRWMVMRWDAEAPWPIKAYRPYDYLRITRQSWRDWAQGLRYDGPWRHHVLRSALALKMLVYGPTGAMVAAPTTSLPEWRGGQRNWDYRFTWSRDAAMAIRAQNVLGYASEAREFFHFLRTALDADQTLRVMYTVDGRPVPTEQTLPHLRGFAGSGPVRVGNGARDQLQLDTIGAVLDAAYLHELFGGCLSLRTWSRLRRVVDMLRTTWNEPDDGIWEPRGHRQHNVHSKVMSWLAFDRALRIAPRFGDFEAADRWQTAAARVRDEILRNGLDPTGRHFCASYGSDHVDGALLVLPLHGFVEPQDPLMVATIARIRDQLGTGPFVHRYRVDDGVGGPEGAFVLCGFWLAEALALQGRLDEAIDVFVAHAEASNHLGLLAEEVDPQNGEQLGNFPQAFSHLGLINAAVRIDLALRMRDEGQDGIPRVTDRLETQRS